MQLYTKGLDYVKVVELQKWRNVPHIHALVSGSDKSLTYARNWSWREIGYNKVVQYEPTLGAGYYLGKYLVKDQISQVEFSPSIIAKLKSRKLVRQ